MIELYSCAHCSAPVSPQQAATTTSCATCGRPWNRLSGVARNVVDLPGVRSRAGEATQSGETEALTRVASQDVPALLGLIGDLLRSVVALNGECTCKVLRVRSRKTGPCPHWRANEALRRAGVSPAQVGEIQNRIDRRVP